MGKKNRSQAKSLISSSTKPKFKLDPLVCYVESPLLEPLKIFVTHATHSLIFLELSKEILDKKLDPNWPTYQSREESFEAIARNVCAMIKFKSHRYSNPKIKDDNVKEVLLFLRDQGVSSEYLLERIEEPKYRNMCGASKSEVENIKYNQDTLLEPRSCNCVSLDHFAHIMYKILTEQSVTKPDLQKFFNTEFKELGLTSREILDSDNLKVLGWFFLSFADTYSFKSLLSVVEENSVNLVSSLFLQSCALQHLVTTHQKLNLRHELAVKTYEMVEKIKSKVTTQGDSHFIKPKNQEARKTILQALDLITNHYLKIGDVNKALDILVEGLETLPQGEFKAIKNLLIEIFNLSQDQKARFIDKILNPILDESTKVLVLNWFMLGFEALYYSDLEKFKSYSSQKDEINRLLINKETLNKTADITFTIMELYLKAKIGHPEILDLIANLEINPELSERWKNGFKTNALSFLVDHITKEEHSLGINKLNKIAQIVEDTSTIGPATNILMAGIYCELSYASLDLAEAERNLRKAFKYLEKTNSDLILDKALCESEGKDAVYSTEKAIIRAIHLGFSYKKYIKPLETIATTAGIYYQFKSFEEFITNMLTPLKAKETESSLPSIQDTAEQILDEKVQKLDAEQIQDNLATALPNSQMHALQQAESLPKDDSSIPAIESKVTSSVHKLETINKISKQHDVIEDESTKIARALDQYYKKLKKTQTALKEEKIFGIKQIHNWSNAHSDSDKVIEVVTGSVYAKIKEKCFKKHPALLEKVEYILKEKGIAKDAKSEGLIWLDGEYCKVWISAEDYRPLGKKEEAKDSFAILVTLFKVWRHTKMDKFINGGCKLLKDDESEDLISDSDGYSSDDSVENASEMPSWPSELGKILETHDQA